MDVTFLSYQKVHLDHFMVTDSNAVFLGAFGLSKEAYQRLRSNNGELWKLSKDERQNFFLEGDFSIRKSHYFCSN